LGVDRAADRFAREQVVGRGHTGPRAVGRRFAPDVWRYEGSEHRRSNGTSAGFVGVRRHELRSHPRRIDGCVEVNHYRGLWFGLLAGFECLPPSPNVPEIGMQVNNLNVVRSASGAARGKDNTHEKQWDSWGFDRAYLNIPLK
jgi:hypothetical protein